MALSEGFFLLCQSRTYQRFHSWILYISLKPAQIKPAARDLSWHWLSRVALNSYIYLAQCGLHAACAFELMHGSSPREASTPTKDRQAVAHSLWPQQERLPAVPAAGHVPLPFMKLSNGMPLSLIKGLSEGREGTLFWLEFHKAQVVQPAARSLVLVGCTPALGLFIVLSLVVKEEEWQEGTVGP